MSDQAYPTREQAERIATDRCPLKDCPACDIAHWCASDIMDLTSASQACGKSMLAMHDALDAKQAEIDRLRKSLMSTSHSDPLPGSNVSQAQLDKIHFDSMQDWE